MDCLLRCFGSGTDLLSNELFCCDGAAQHLNQHLLQLVIGLVQVASERIRDLNTLLVFTQIIPLEIVERFRKVRQSNDPIILCNVDDVTSNFISKFKKAII